MNFLLAQTVDVPPDAIAALSEALASHSYIVAAVVAVLVLAPLLLKAFKVNVPFLDPILSVLLKVAQSFVKSKPVVNPAEPPKPVDGVDQVAQVHDINELKGPKP